jgi:hypothetical protein
MSPVCKKCSAQHVTSNGAPACVGHKRSTGAACRAHPVGGTVLCSKHGGMTPSIRRKGEQRVAEAKVERTVADLLAEHDLPDQHPFEALLDLSRRMGAMTRMLEQVASEYRTTGDDERLQAALGLYERFGRLSAQVSKTVLDANIEERMVQISEQVNEDLVRKVFRAMRAAALTPEQTSALRKAIAEEFRGDMTPEQRERSAQEHWDRQQQPYRGQALPAT